MSGPSVNLITLFLGRLRPPKRLTSTLCTYFCQQLPFLNQRKDDQSMWPDRVSNPGPLTYESGALSTVLRGQANFFQVGEIKTFCGEISQYSKKMFSLFLYLDLVNCHKW